MKFEVRDIHLKNIQESNLRGKLEELISELDGLKQLVKEEINLKLLSYIIPQTNNNLVFLVDVYTGKSSGEFYYRVEGYSITNDENNDERRKEVFRGGFSSSDIKNYIKRKQLELL
ncbi:MAG: hypothetical protein KatS3mg001_543 [Candidatus Pacearchaeota archaeon]|nr:MAG: hypothetical protein KatS3mg001_543 [Candidatus Pacearchaeota archaeon]